MENDYRITKLHGTLIGDNRIPDLPDGETAKILSSTNGKTAWVDLPEGGKSVPPTLVLSIMGDDDIVQKTSITEEEKTNLEKGLYNSVFYADLSLGPVADNSAFFPEPLVQIENRYIFSFYTFSFDETTQKVSIDGTTTKNIQVGEKNADGTYKLIISDEFNEAIPFGGGGGGGASVSPCLNLMNMEDSSVRTSITEEEKTNLENGLYNSVLYADLSKVEAGFYSAYFPETMATIVQGNPFFSTYDISVDESTGGLTITGTSVYSIAVEEEKNADGTYPIRIQKAINGTFGGGGGGGGSSTPSTSIAFKDITVSKLANYVGKFENLHITDLKIALTDTTITGAYFSGIIGSSTSLQGGLWISFGSDSNQLIYLGNGGYAIKNGVIKGGNLNVGSFNAIRMGELNTLSSLLKFNSSIGADMLSRVPDEGNFAYIGTLEDNNGFGIAICSSSAVNLSATGEETYCKFTGLFREGKGIGCMEMKKGANDVPQFKSFTTWLPPVTANSNGKALIVTDGNAQWTNIPRYEHTITIKNSAGAILWTQTMRNSSNTIVNSYANLKTLFGEATYAGFGEYCQLDLRGGTEATDKLIKADGTEATLESLGAIVYTDVCFLPK